jgi:FAD dependent oxidoreductase TIGR03364
MTNERHAVIGGGIVGLALARALARRSRAVTVLEADRPPQGASIRNFGTLWPVGQPAGPRRTMALESLAIWRDVLAESGAWSRAEGSLHLAYHADESAVLVEFAERANADGFACELLGPRQVRQRCEHVRAEGLVNGLWSPHETQINPRQVMSILPQWMAERWGVRFEDGARVTSCSGGVVRAGHRSWTVDQVWLASGADTQTLYPEAFAAHGFRKCKLQMMRTTPVGWSLGPVLAGGLTLTHYESFNACPSLPALKTRLADEWAAQVAHGVHVLVSQHDRGELMLGDSHEYDESITPFDKPEIDALVLKYLQTFFDWHDFQIAERWHGIYLKSADGPYQVFSPEPGVTVVAGLGGHGMTLSFGLAEEIVSTRMAG